LRRLRRDPNAAIAGDEAHTVPVGECPLRLDAENGANEGRRGIGSVITSEMKLVGFHL
jgi:hypothetical protein